MNFAVIGSNFIVDLWMDAFKQVKDCVLHTVYSRTTEQALINQKKWGAQHICTQFDALLNNSEIDAVYIASPNFYHETQVEACIKAKKHVFCEKPMVKDAKTSVRLFALAQKNNVLLLEAMRPQFLPCMHTIEQKIQEIGTLHFAEFTYCQYSSRYDKFKNGIIENAFNPTLYNGALMDIGIYCISVLERLFGMPNAIQASATFLPQSIDQTGNALLSYDAFDAFVSYSKVHDSYRPCVIEGEKASIALSPFPVPRQMIITYKKDQKTETIDFNLKKNDVVYEIEQFIHLTSHLEQAEFYQTRCQNTLTIMDAIRTQCSIDFTKK